MIVVIPNDRASKDLTARDPIPKPSPAFALFEKELLTDLYLRHGGGEDETGWTRQGHVNSILSGQPAAMDHYRRESVATPAE